MSPGPRVLRVFFDFGHSWPLWESGTHKLAMEPSDYGFSGELTSLLARWFALWEPIASFDIGQPVPTPTEQDRETEGTLAWQAVATIRNELPADVDLDASLIGF